MLHAPVRVQMEAFLEEHRRSLRDCLDDLSEEQARVSLVPSSTTLLGLVKHATFVEKVWFGEAVTAAPVTNSASPPVQRNPSSSPTMTRSLG